MISGISGRPQLQFPKPPPIYQMTAYYPSHSSHHTQPVVYTSSSHGHGYYPSQYAPSGDYYPQPSNVVYVPSHSHSGSSRRSRRHHHHHAPQMIPTGGPMVCGSIDLNAISKSVILQPATKLWWPLFWWSLPSPYVIWRARTTLFRIGASRAFQIQVKQGIVGFPWVFSSTTLYRCDDGRRG
jgi:hypothetical protein